MAINEYVPIIGEAIYAILSSDTDVTDLVSTRIYPIIAPQDTVAPYIIYEDRRAEPLVTKDGAFERDYWFVEIMAINNSYKSAREVSIPVIRALNGYRGEPVSGLVINKIRLEGHLAPAYDEKVKLYAARQSYKVFVNK